jgi:hypothetical protein
MTRPVETAVMQHHTALTANDKKSMKIEIKTINITKSKINQMGYIGIPKNPNVEVLGWVNMDKKRYVIVKLDGSYYRAEYIIKVHQERKMTQLPLEGGGWEYPTLTHLVCDTYNRSISYSVDIDEEKNLLLYDHFVSFKRKTEIAGQIYY